MSLGHGSSVVRAGLILYLDATNVKSYPGSGTSWKDLSGVGNDFTAIHPIVLVDESNPLNRHFVYNATDRYAILSVTPESFNYNRSSFAVCGWVRYGSQPNSGNGVIVSKWNSDNSLANEFMLGTNDVGQFKFSVDLNDGLMPDNQLNDSVLSTTTIVPNVWYCVCGVFNNGTTSIYVNGTLENTISNATYTAVNPNTFSYLQVARIGGYGATPAQHSSGNVSIVQMYTQSLSAADINYNFNVQRGRHGV